VAKQENAQGKADKAESKAKASPAGEKPQAKAKAGAPATKPAAETKAEAGAKAASKNGKPARDGYTPRLKKVYLEEVVPALMKNESYHNPMQAPHIEKVVINIGMGTEARENAKSLDNASGDIMQITGQKPVVTRAKKSIAAFKLREGMPIGVMVTLRGPKMWEFLDKLINISLARVRDFNGVSPKSFDGHGNYTLGLREQLIFPEIDYDKIDRIRGMEVVIVTSARNDEEGHQLLQLLGMPFRKQS
jgi:large subunit ribosomal protein L5